MKEKVIIASKNPVKINSAKIAFQKNFPNKNFDFEGINIESGVSNQPMNDKETLLGARNRANKAKEEIKNAHYWIGIEGGIEEKEKETQAFAWIVIKTQKKEGKAKTQTFFLPKKVTELIKQGKELGHANDIIFKDQNSKQKNGAVGILTKNIITRTTFYSDAITLALIPFKNTELY